MVDKTFTGAKIYTYEPDGSAPARLRRFVDEPCLLVRTDSPRWAKYAGKAAKCSLLCFRTPDGPVLTISYRIRECFLFVVCDLGDPEVCRLLDSWKTKGVMHTRTVFGDKMVTALEPAKDLHQLDGFRNEVRHHDAHAFLRSSVFLREAGVLEQYAAHGASKGPERIAKGALTIDVHMLQTEKLANTALEYFMEHRPGIFDDMLQSTATH
jgi:hypothetical protein